MLYDSTYEDSQQKAIDEARRLSCNLGLGFEVVDRSTSSLFRRFLLALRNSQSANPSVVLAPSTYADSERQVPDSLV